MKKKIILLGAVLLGLVATTQAQTFYEVTDDPFFEAERGDVAFADVDGDGDQDVVISGGSNPTKLYINNGSGAFAEDTTASLTTGTVTKVGFFDADDDGDQDLCLASYEGTRFYKNDGSGTFTQVGATLPGGGFAVYGKIAIADVDGDNDLDVLTYGATSSQGKSVTLYINDGSGVFIPVYNIPFPKIFNGSAAFADVDGDGDQDLLISGNTAQISYNSSLVSKLYLNDGVGNFTEDVNATFVPVQYSTTTFADIDDDGDQDVLVTGQGNSGGSYASRLYTNDGTGTFTEMAGTPFGSAIVSATSFADMDGDNDLDLLIVGSGSTVYLNDGNGTFSESYSYNFADLVFSAAALTDFDGDNKLDLIINGRRVGTYVGETHYYTQDSTTVGSFTLGGGSDNGGGTNSIEEIDAFGLSIFPNPASETIFVEAQNTNIHNIEIFNLVGEQMLQTNEQKIDLSNLPSGVYFLQVTDMKGSVVSKKFAKQ